MKLKRIEYKMSNDSWVVEIIEEGHAYIAGEFPSIKLAIEYSEKNHPDIEYELYHGAIK